VDDGTLRCADEVVVRDRAAVGVELLARLEDDGVQPALGIGELHPVTGDERPCHGLPRRLGRGHRLVMSGLGRFLLRVHGRPAYGAPEVTCGGDAARALGTVGGAS
jgi:hypothetical protein